ncbi:MAG: alpha/beta hydrolase [Gemmatimonadetes bacterium]|nr:alpha/beta hydrolase [Gemmatimonadota bacterium]MYD14899.1 alpha/beta hydrolase [Gemmatimonadota bacterium]MYI65793.1 alpha/beta hydrolase [Gemmatimonadota bacterium]
MEGVILKRIETTPRHGDVIRADVRRPAAAAPRTAVVVAHGFKGFKDWGFFPLLCNRLALDGHLVVSFNTSLNGIGADLFDFTELDAFGRNTVSREVADLHWMVDRTLEGVWDGGRGPEALGLLGHSRGGGNAVIVAAERGEVSSLVTWAAVSTYHRWSPEQERDWAAAGVTYILNARTGQEMPLHRAVFDDLRENAERFDILAAARRVRAPWLVVHGAEDATVSAQEARRLAEAGPAADLLVLEGSGHTFEAVHPLEETPAALGAAVAASLRHLRRGCNGGWDRQS